MKRILQFAAILLMGTGAVAQNGASPPPADSGIGNSTMSPAGSGSSPTMNPRQNKDITHDYGSTTGDKTPGAAAATGAQTGTSTNAQGAVASGAQGNNPSGSQKSRNRARKRHKKSPPKQSGQGKTISSPTYPTGGPSTTEAPGPATGAYGTRNVPQGGNGQYSGTSSSKPAQPMIAALSSLTASLRGALH